MAKKTFIIAGFPGVGKSWLKNNYGETVSDSDSSKFDKSNFPQNYINHIKGLIGNKDIVLVSTHKDVLQKLEEEKINYILVYPDHDLKEEYLERYKRRGSPEGFIKLLSDKWTEFLNDIEEANPTKRVVLKRGEYLKDKLQNDKN